MPCFNEDVYKSYFRNMLLEFMQYQKGIQFPQSDISIRSQYATNTYLVSIEHGDMPCIALDKAREQLFKGIEPHLFESI